MSKTQRAPDGNIPQNATPISASSTDAPSHNAPPSNGAAPPWTVQDELDKLVVEQLHKATLNFSAESQEIKKLCVTLVTAIFTLLTAFSKTIVSNIEITRFWMASLCACVPLLFWFVDAVTYYYQKKLRCRMQDKLNAIRKRYSIAEEDDEKKVGALRAFFNKSNLMYLVLGILAFGVAFALMSALPVDNGSTASTPSTVMVVICTESPTPAPTPAAPAPTPAASVPPQTT